MIVATNAKPAEGQDGIYHLLKLEASELPEELTKRVFRTGSR